MRLLMIRVAKFTPIYVFLTVAQGFSPSFATRWPSNSVVLFSLLSQIFFVKILRHVGHYILHPTCYSPIPSPLPCLWNFNQFSDQK